MSQAGITNITGGSSPSVPTEFGTDSGTAIPSANQLDIIGAGGITTSGLGNVVTITGSGGSLPTGAQDTVLQGQGVGNPPAYSTATFPSTATDTGKVLIADGTNWVASTPTFPNASATSGKIIKSDGTNWLASTETYAEPSTSGNLMISDGTNWTSENPTVYSATLNLTNAQIKALFTTPITIVAAPGAGKVITVISVITKYIYGGTNAFTGGGNLNIRYTGTSGQSISAAIMTSALINGTAFVYSQVNITNISGAAIANMENRPVVIHNLTALFAGNAANNNTINVKILYYITEI